MIKLVLKPNILDLKTISHTIEYDKDKVLSDYIEETLQYLVDINENGKNLIKMCSVKVLVNSVFVDNDALESTKVKDNSVIIMGIEPQAPLLPIIMFIGTIVMSAIESEKRSKMNKPQAPTPNTNELGDSGTYTWEGPTTTYAIGKAIPWVYGDYAIGGNIVSANVSGVQEISAIGFHSLAHLGWPLNSGGHNTPHLMTGNYPIVEGSITSDANTTPQINWHDDSAFGHRYNELERGYYYNLKSVDVDSQRFYNIFGDFGKRRVQTNKINIVTSGEVQLAYGYLNTGQGFIGRQMWDEVELWYRIAGSDGPFIRGDAWLHDFTAFWAAWNYHYANNSLLTLFQNAPWWTSEKAYTFVFPDGYQYYELLVWQWFTYNDTAGDHYEWYRKQGVPRYIKTGLTWHGVIPDPEFSRDIPKEESDSITDQQSITVGIALSGGELSYISEDEFYIDDIKAKQIWDMETAPGKDSPAYMVMQTERYYGQNIQYILKREGSSAPGQLNRKTLHKTTANWSLQPGIWAGDPGGGVNGVEIFPWTTVSRDVEGIEIVFLFPYGLWVWNNTDNKSEPASVILQIRYRRLKSNNQPAGDWLYISTNEDTQEFVITDYALTAINRTIVINDLPPARYEIQIKRVSGPVLKSQEGWDELKITSLNEIGNALHKYPNTAIFVLNMIASDRFSGSLPSLQIPVRGRYVKVPILRSGDVTVPLQEAYTDYDDVTEAYVWKRKLDDAEEILTIYPDSTTYQYTNCPPFIIYDMLVNDKSFPRITEDTLVWDDFVDAAEFCWESVSSDLYASNIGVERRFELDLVIDSATDASSLIQQIALLMRSKTYWIGDKFRLVVLKPEPITQIFTEADIIENSYIESYLPDKDIPNTFEATFYNRDYRYRQDNVVITKKDNSFKQKEIKSMSASLLGVTKQKQAIRTANYLLNELQTSSKTIKFETPSKALACTPGEVIGVQQRTTVYGDGGSLRQDSVNSLVDCTFYLEKSIYLAAGEYNIIVNRRNEHVTSPVVASFTIIVAEYYDEIVVDEVIDPAPLKNDVWYVVPTTTACRYDSGISCNLRQYQDVYGTGSCPNGEALGGCGYEAISYIMKCRIVSITYDGKDADKAVILAEPYDPGIYTDSYYGGNVSIPIVPEQPPAVTVPQNVRNLSAVQMEGAYQVKVTYTMPWSNYNMFDAEVSDIFNYDSETKSGTLYYSSDDDSYLTKSATLFFYDTTGIFKGKAVVTHIDIDRDIIGFSCLADFSGDPTDDDKMVQKNDSAYLPISHVEISRSWNGRDYTNVGSDSSKGQGFLIEVTKNDVGKTLWVKAQTVAFTGTKSVNPPTTSCRIGDTRCLPTPTHLILCGQADGDVHFTGSCDCCIEWSASMGRTGAGQGVQAGAGDEAAGFGPGDHNISGFTVYIYDNTNVDDPIFLRSVSKELDDATYVYTHDMNIEDQTDLGRNNKGTRRILFRVEQVSDDGLVSCIPAELPAENEAPSMNGFIPEVYPGILTARVDWSKYPATSLYAADIEGYKVYYRKYQALSDPWLTYDAGTALAVQLGVPSQGRWTFFVMAYDCFGVGDIGTDASDEVTVYIGDLPPQVYIPPKPQGMVCSCQILAAGTEGGRYVVETDTDLSDYGFDNDQFINNRIFYNLNPAADNYCPVTATDKNTLNLITAITYNEETSRWKVKFEIPLEADLIAYEYTAADGVPQIGQQFNINVFAEHTYGSVFRWYTGLTTQLKIRWFAANSGLESNPHLRSQIDNYRMTLNGRTYLGEYPFPYNENLSFTAGDMEEGDVAVEGNEDYTWYTIGGISTQHNTLDGTFTMKSKGGQRSEPLVLDNIKIVTELVVLPELEIPDFQAHTDEAGKNLQIVVSNWETYFLEPTIEQFEVFCTLGWFCYKHPDDATTLSTGGWSPDAGSVHYYTDMEGLCDSDVAWTDDINCTSNDYWNTNPVIARENCCYNYTDSRTTEEWIIHECWSKPSIFDTLHDAVEGGLVLYPYEEETILEDHATWVRERIVTKMAHDGSDFTEGYFHLGSFRGPVFHYNFSATKERRVCECHVDHTAACSECTDPEEQTTTMISYNTYFVAFAVRRSTGELEWVMDDEDDSKVKVIRADFNLIDSMSIKDLSVTNALIANLAVTDAKILNCYAEKIIVGPTAQFESHCFHDVGGRCELYGDESLGVYREGDCPYGPAGTVECDTTGVGKYTPHLFSIQNLFDIVDGLPDVMDEYVYISGGFIKSNSIKTRSIQIGALPVAVNVCAFWMVDTEYDDVSVGPENMVRIRYGGPHDLENDNVACTFADGSTFWLERGEAYFLDDSIDCLPEHENCYNDGALPVATGEENVVMWCAYFNYVDAKAAEEYGDEEDPRPISFMKVTDYDQESSFNRLRYQGYFPLFLVLIVRDSKREAGTETQAQILTQEAASSSMGNLFVRFVYVNPSPGTFIVNDDVTTGIVHNIYGTSVLDLRPYTGPVTDWGSLGQGRLCIDAPSQFYPRAHFWDELGQYSRIGDNYGKAWWNFFTEYHQSSGDEYYKIDTKLLIGRPYVDGLEAMEELGGASRDVVEGIWGDPGYLWYYRAWQDINNDPGNPEWRHVGHLEIGGRLRVKQIAVERELLIGTRYNYADEAWTRVSSSSINYYEAGPSRSWGSPPWELPYLENEGPKLLCRISKKFEMFDWDANRAFLIGRIIPTGYSIYDLVQSYPDDYADDGTFDNMGIALYDASTPLVNNPSLLMKIGGDSSVQAVGDGTTTHHYFSTPTGVTTDITMLIDYGQKIPLLEAYFPTETNGPTTLGILIPDIGLTNRGVGVLISSSSDIVNDPPNFAGLYVSGNIHYGVYTNVQVNKTLTPNYEYVYGGYFSSRQNFAGGRSVGIQARAHAGGTDTEAIGVGINVSPSATADWAHVRCDNILYITPPEETFGQTGDIIAGGDGLYYKSVARWHRLKQGIQDMTWAWTGFNNGQDNSGYYDWYGDITYDPADPLYVVFLPQYVFCNEEDDHYWFVSWNTYPTQLRIQAWGMKRVEGLLLVFY